MKPDQGPRAADRLNQDLSRQMEILLRCTGASSSGGRVLIATPEASRYPYVYLRDASSALQLFRRLAGSRLSYDAGAPAYELMRATAQFVKQVQAACGAWGQRYSLTGEDRSIYKQEDNTAHGIAILCNFLLTASRRGDEIAELEDYLVAIARALDYCVTHIYQRELNLFQSTTAIHESALERGYTCWVNFSYLYALSLANEVATQFDRREIIDARHRRLREHFLRSVSELFLSGGRYVRRIDPRGQIDWRPDITLLSPFYFGFLHYREEIERSARFLEAQLWDPELGMIMRYLPFYDDSAVHLHAGNGPWLQYTAMLAQFHFWSGNQGRGDELLALIEGSQNQRGEIPEHLSTCKRFEWFLEREWRSGKDFAKEFDAAILLDPIDFDRILEEANNMARSYRETAELCMVRDPARSEGGTIQFAIPLMWSHVEYARALLMRAGDWWKLEQGSPGA
ncbi:MAG TPA: hypothetical protein VGB99_13365 [Acidobacteriota bacterium]